eukprot:TRINITY_DN1393_c1_g1_i3.p1 TRINITY_DN1393_c1_g1~~TRINITY_DN1393_c1_g1_i3.p1  ORF type:complete len:700 (+),score=136.30 TRINITY_DN1393_c1_g1_i3:8-2107(+)
MRHLVLLIILYFLLGLLSDISLVSAKKGHCNIQKKYDNTTVSILLADRDDISQLLMHRASEFSKQTGLAFNFFLLPSVYSLYSHLDREFDNPALIRAKKLRELFLSNHVKNYNSPPSPWTKSFHPHAVRIVSTSMQATKTSDEKMKQLAKKSERSSGTYVQLNEDYMMVGSTECVVRVNITSLKSNNSLNGIDGFLLPARIATDFYTYLNNIALSLISDFVISWEDIFRTLRLSLGPSQKVVSIPLDGNILRLFYRTDLLAAYNFSVPATWKELTDLAELFDNSDLNSDGIEDYGICVAKKRYGIAPSVFYGILAPMLNIKGTNTNISQAFFGISDSNIVELESSDAFSYSLGIWRSLTDNGPAQSRQFDLTDTRKLFFEGRCAFTIDYLSIAVAPDWSEAYTPYISSTLLPGSRDVQESYSENLNPCSEHVCPYASNSPSVNDRTPFVNYAPVSTLEELMGSVNSESSLMQKAAVYEFFSYTSSPNVSMIDVLDEKLFSAPYRLSQIRSPLWPSNVSSVLLSALRVRQHPNFVVAMVENGTSLMLDVLDQQLDEFEQVGMGIDDFVKRAKLMYLKLEEENGSGSVQEEEEDVDWRVYLIITGILFFIFSACVLVAGILVTLYFRYRKRSLPEEDYESLKQALVINAEELHLDLKLGNNDVVQAYRGTYRGTDVVVKKIVEPMDDQTQKRFQKATALLR